MATKTQDSALPTNRNYVKYVIVESFILWCNALDSYNIPCLNTVRKEGKFQIAKVGTNQKLCVSKVDIKIRSISK